MFLDARWRRGAAGLLATSALLLQGCASVPAGSAMELDPGKRGVKFDTGRVALTVTDYGGFPLRKAMVNVEAIDSEDYFRTAAFSDNFGQVSFNGLPDRVRITVFHAETAATYSRVFDVPSSGLTELRMILETFEE
jgi:hypothetical protein